MEGEKEKQAPGAPGVAASDVTTKSWTRPPSSVPVDSNTSRRALRTSSSVSGRTHPGSPCTSYEVVPTVDLGKWGARSVRTGSGCACDGAVTPRLRRDT